MTPTEEAAAILDPHIQAALRAHLTWPVLGPVAKHAPTIELWVVQFLLALADPKLRQAAQLTCAWILENMQLIGLLHRLVSQSPATFDAAMKAAMAEAGCRLPDA